MKLASGASGSRTIDLLDPNKAIGMAKKQTKQSSEEKVSPFVNTKKFRRQGLPDREGRFNASSIQGIREEFFRKSANRMQQQPLRSFSSCKEYGVPHVSGNS